MVTDPNASPNGGAVGQVGAAHLYSPAGVLISTLNGSNAGDQVGSGGITVLSNGNYVVSSPNWNQAAGAVTWCDADLGIPGVVSAANSLVGTTSLDVLNSGVTALTNGNYVVRTPFWDDGTTANVGAVT